MYLSWRQMRRPLGIFAIALGGLTSALTLGGSVSAHHPVLEAQTDRPCGDDAPWTATVSSQSDRDRDKDWSSRHRVDERGRSDWSPLTDDQVPYVFQVGPFEASVVSTKVHVDSRWYSKYDGSQSASATRSITIARPDTWICDTPTTTPTTPTTAVTPDAPSVGYDCEIDELVITGADDSDTVDYTVTVDQTSSSEASTWTVTINATPQPGYRFPPDAETEWTFTDTVDCLTTTAAPAVPQLACRLVPNSGLAVELTTADTYTYEVTGSLDVVEDQPYEVIVVAVPAAGYEFPPDAVTEWTFTGVLQCQRSAAPSPTTTIATTTPSTTTTTTVMATQSPTTTLASATQLPRTGSSSTTLLLAYAAIVTLLGGFLTLVRRSSGPATD